MSINGALLSGVTGLAANSVALGAISDNIANSNTVGYKRNTTNFEDLVTTQSAGVAYNSGGVLANVTQLISQQGQLQQTGNATDLAVSGDGFFVVSSTATGSVQTDPRSFTRAGSFTPDSAGYLKNAAGLYLQGWPADPTTGAISTDPSDLSKLSSINVAGIANSPDPTANVSLDANLNAATPVSTQEATYSAAAPGADMSSGAVTPDFSTQATLYDSKGGAHTVQIDFLKSSTTNQWHAEAHVSPATDLAGSTDGQIASGVVAFNPDGTLDTAATTFPTSLAIGASAATTGVRWSSASGLAAQTSALNLSKSPGALTEYDSASTYSATSDGGVAGTLQDVTVGKDGFVTANFSNGTSRNIAQVALATFPNADGLQSASGDTYLATRDSGALNLKIPGSDGSGTLSSGSLESSTVDLSTEFTGLITTQRAYSASSKIITTADQMLQELINTKQ